MALLGADGRSREELKQYLKFDAGFSMVDFFDMMGSMMSSGSASTAIVLYTNPSIQPFIVPEYIDQLKNQLSSDIISADDAVQIINSCVYERTNGKIKELLSAGAKVSDIMLLNAVAFESPWLHEYYDYETKDGCFTNANGKVEPVKETTG